MPATAEDAATLLTSQKAIGDQSSYWLTKNILGDHIQAGGTRRNYLQAISRVLSEARLSYLPDWRYILASSHRTTRLREALSAKMKSHNATGEMMANALKRLLKELRQKLVVPEMADGKRREWRMMIGELEELIDHEKAMGDQHRRLRKKELEKRKQEAPMATTEQRMRIFAAARTHEVRDGWAPSGRPRDAERNSACLQTGSIYRTVPVRRTANRNGGPPDAP